MHLGAQSLKRRTLAMAAFAVVIVIAMVAYQVWHGYNQAKSSAKNDLIELGAVLSEGTAAIFRSAEIMADHAIQDLLRQGDRPNWQVVGQRVVENAQNWNFVFSTTFISNDGQFQFNAVRNEQGQLLQAAPPQAPSNIFPLHSAATKATDQVQISGPYIRTLNEGKIVALSKGVYATDGTFLGVAVISIHLETVTQLLSNLLRAHVRSAVLWGADGRIIATTLLADGIKPKGLLPRYAQTWPPLEPEMIEHRYEDPKQPNEYILSYQRVGNYPLVISVAAKTEDVFHAWWRNTAAAIASAFIGILLIAALARGIIKRIDDQQRAQQALQRSEHSLRESQRLSGIGHYERWIDTGEYFWGDNMYEIHGVSREEFQPTRESFFKFVVPDDRDHFIRSWTADNDDRRARGTFECRIKLPSGDIKYMRYSWQVVNDGMLAPTRTFGVAQDMTAIRRAETTIREDEERLRDIVECSSDYIWETDVDGRTTFFTGPGAHKFRGPGDAHPDIFQLPLHSGDAATLLGLVDKRQKIRSVTVRWVDNDGETHHIRISGNPRFDNEQRFLGYRGAAAEVTEAVQRREREEVTRRNEALARLASGLAHEINNLLQPITIYAAFGTSEHGLAQNVRQYFSRIATAADRASEIVKNVLSFARGGQTQKEFVNPNDVARECIDLLSGGLNPNVSLTFEAHAEDALVRVNRTGLVQVITNLVANATDVLRKGGRVVIGVSKVALGNDAAGLSLRPGLYCRIDVQDNGPGIAPSHMREIFEPFFTTKPQGQGTGLGLSVVSGLVKSWGGTVTVNSIPNEMTCFTIYLPLAERQLQAAQ